MLNTYTFVGNDGEDMKILSDYLVKWISLMPDAYIDLVIIKNATRPTLTIYYRK